MAEQFETSPEGRVVRVDRSVHARRSSDEIDALVRSCVGALSGTTFTHDEIAAASGLSTMAAAHSLKRLHRLGVIAEVERLRVRSQRFRPVWRATTLAAIPPDAPEGTSQRTTVAGRSVSPRTRGAATDTVPGRSVLSESTARRLATLEPDDRPVLAGALTS